MINDEKVIKFAAPVGLIYIFNLIIGTGALAMPKAFQDAGYVLGIITTAFLAFVSYLAFTFVVESMSAANAVVATKKAQKLKELAVEAANGSDSTTGSDLESQDRQPVCRFPVMVKPNYFEIEQRIEIGSMASMFLGKWGVYLFYTCLIVYLYGDLAIYSTVVPKSLMNVVCTYQTDSASNSSCISYNVSTSSPCWNHSSLSRISVYRLMVFLFALFVGPFVFLNVSKTKYLQFFTTLSRWTAFALMIAFACKRLSMGQSDGRPPVANASKFANLFGISVYAFMCHHSLPSVVTPMKSKTGIYPLVFVVYCIILLFYITLSLTGAFAFATLEDIYTLNFLRQCSDAGRTFIFIIVQYFLALFPVFTLSTNFPIVGITLRNNIIALASSFVEKSPGGAAPTNLHNTETTENENENVDAPEVDVNLHSPLIEIKSEIMESRSSSKWFVIFKRAIAPLLVILPPIAISLSTDNVEFLASVTGSYAGVGVQYVIPALLVFGARRTMGAEMPPSHVSPFGHKIWIYWLLMWATLTVVLVTVNHIMTGF